jgi:hypothetical protein
MNPRLARGLRNPQALCDCPNRSTNNAEEKDRVFPVIHTRPPLAYG